MSFRDFLRKFLRDPSGDTGKINDVCSYNIYKNEFCFTHGVHENTYNSQLLVGW